LDSSWPNFKINYGLIALKISYLHFFQLISAVFRAQGNLQPGKYHTNFNHFYLNQLQYDEELDGKIDGTQIGDVVRAAGLKPTNAAVWKAAGQEYKRKGEKRLTFEEWAPIYEQLTKERVSKIFGLELTGLIVVFWA
jgi:hypothetical protein